jgi:hypothetical protein
MINNQFIIENRVFSGKQIRERLSHPTVILSLVPTQKDFYIIKEKWFGRYFTQ